MVDPLWWLLWQDNLLFYQSYHSKEKKWPKKVQEMWELLQSRAGAHGWAVPGPACSQNLQTHHAEHQ